MTMTASIAWAAGPGVAVAAEDIFEIEEIVVTAQKRTQSLQDIPLAVTVFSGDVLREDDITSLQDIGNRTPGLVFSAFSVGQPEITIRGIGTKEDGASASDSTIVSVDDVYIAARTAQVFDIFDLERIEVLRGPQGTLYGKNSIGGSINFVTTTPTEDTNIRLRQTVASYGRIDTAGLLSGRIAENLYGKFSFSRRSHDGYIRNILVDEQQGESNTFAWRAMLRWLPNENTEVILSVDFADDDLGATNREPVGSAGPLHDGPHASNPIAVNEALGGADDPHDSLADVEGFTDREVRGYSLKINWDIGSTTLTSISSYRESDFDWIEDSEGLPPSTAFADLTGASGSPGPALTADPSTGFAFDVSDAAIEHTEQLTQELRLTSSAENRLTWVGGLFYSHEEIDRTETFFFPSLGGPGLNAPSLSSSDQSNNSDSLAAYGQGTFAVNDRLLVTGGVRFSYEKKDIGIGANIITGLPLLLQGFPFTEASEDWSNVTGRFAVDYSVTNDVLLYAGFSTGFKSGGFTGSASTAERGTTPFGPENAKNYEVGMKSKWADNRVLLNLTAFFTDYDSLQVTRFFQPLGSGFGQFITENAGAAEIKGIEAEFVALLTEGLEVGGNYAYLDAEFTDFTGTPSVTGTGDFTGNRLRLSPKHSLSWYGKYAWVMDIGTVSAKVSYRYQSLSFMDPNNNAITTIPAYDIWDTRVAFESADGHWEVAGWVKNLGDEKYRTHVFSQRGSRIAFALFGAPRTGGVTVTYNY
ncbi:MAG: TonB-dependent receptor [Sphingomonadales bacterium]